MTKLTTANMAAATRVAAATMEVAAADIMEAAADIMEVAAATAVDIMAAMAGDTTADTESDSEFLNARKLEFKVCMKMAM
ncbi:hypothetical protein [Salmonella sp. NW1113]|uniref:hypothetical protein n=1 Tax=unclassified Salmonella TaxID=2614656 RepID=UPI003F42E741